MSTPNNVFLWNPRHEAFVTSGDNADLPPASRAMFGCVVPFMIIFAITGVVMVLLTMREWINYDALSERGVVTQGEYVDYSSSSSDTGPTSYSLVYTYVVNDVEYRGSHGITSVQYALERLGQTLSVLYDPENPAVSQAGTRASTFGRTAMTIFAAIWNVVVVAVVVALYRVANAPARLSKHGQLVLGEILDFTTQDMSTNEELFLISLRYAFTSPKTQAGIERTDKRPRRREGFDFAAPPVTGDRVAILYGSDKQFEVL